MNYSYHNFQNSEFRLEMTEFLLSIQDELYLPDRQAAENIVDLCYAKGGFIAVYDGSVLCGISGYFVGEPQHDFNNTDLGFMYVAGILPQYRRTRLFVTGLAFMLNEFQMMGLRYFRLQAEATNPYTNRLYARFASCYGQSKSLRGIVANCYEGETDLALMSLHQTKWPLTHTKKEPVQLIGSHSQNHMLELMG